MIEPPPPPSAPSTTTAAAASAAVAPAVPPHIPGSCPDSVDSCPRSHAVNKLHEHVVSLPAPSKLRLMCSYGGHIVPRPYDKSLRYLGGETRIVVVDRTVSLSCLAARLSQMLLHGRPFTLKYQLPGEDLDSLVSVTTEEDLVNLIEEYDRIASTSSPKEKPNRLRLFLFPLKPESSLSVGPILESTTKSDDWFLNALNGGQLLNRRFSDSTSVNHLLGLDGDFGSDSCHGDDLELGARGMLSVANALMLEKTLSFGSTSSAPLADLPPIRARNQDLKVGIENQFAQVDVNDNARKQPPDEVSSATSQPPAAAFSEAMDTACIVLGDNPGRVCSDDEEFVQNVPSECKKPPLAQSKPQNPLTQAQHKANGSQALPSPDSVYSETSQTNGMSRQKLIAPQGTEPDHTIDLNIRVSNTHSGVQASDLGNGLHSGYEHPRHRPNQLHVQSHLPQQQQFMMATPQYIYGHPSGSVSLPSYHPIQAYPPSPLDQQYPIYYVAVRGPVPAVQSQICRLPVSQSNGLGEASTATQRCSAGDCNQLRTVPVANPDPGSAGVSTVSLASGVPHFVQVSATQYQQPQGIGHSQIHDQIQRIVGPNSAGTVKHSNGVADLPPEHFSQPQAAPQYKMMTATSNVMFPEAPTAQHLAENIQQQVKS